MLQRPEAMAPRVLAVLMAISCSMFGGDATKIDDTTKTDLGSEYTGAAAHHLRVLQYNVKQGKPGQTCCWGHSSIRTQQQALIVDETVWVTQVVLLQP